MKQFWPTVSGVWEYPMNEAGWVNVASNLVDPSYLFGPLTEFYEE